MKTNIAAILCLCFVAPIIAHGQLTRGWGIKVGAVSATESWDYTADINFEADRRWGLDLGAYVEFLDVPVISVLGEVHYIQKGFSQTLPVTTTAQPLGTGEFITMKPRVDYLSIPVLAKLRFDLGLVSPYIIAGPRFDFLLSKDTEGYGDVLDNFKSQDVGISVGAGAEVALPILPALLAEFRYSPSFSEAYNSNLLTVKNESFELLVGVRL